MKVLVTGATGFVGSLIVKKLLAGGHEVRVLTRNTAAASLKLGDRVEAFLWSDFTEAPSQEALDGVEGVLHLMGENIASGPWTEKRKKSIYESRITSTRSLLQGFKDLGQSPQVFVSTSAVGIYGNRPSEEELDEQSTPGNESDFLTRVCAHWERAALEFKDLGARVAVLRVGVVLGPGDGALKKMLLPFQMGVGGVVAGGKQTMSWIHREDLASLYVECLGNDKYEGVYNATAPRPVTNRVFTKVLGRVLSRPTIFPAPGFALELALGEMASIVVEGQNVVPKRFLEAGYQFKYAQVEPALREILNRPGK